MLSFVPSEVGAYNGVMLTNLRVSYCLWRERGEQRPLDRSDTFITKSYDATSHFETVVEDVSDVWQRVKGEKLVLKKREVEVEA
jgi:RAB protein geranylgeranyltransferase component A